MALVVVLAFLGAALASELPPSCQKPVYCNSKLLHHVQLADLYDDSKTFVDFKQRQSPNDTLKAFDDLLNITNNNPTKEDIKQFVEKYFDSGLEIENWTPQDYSPNPPFLKYIRDEKLRQFAKDINDIWPNLGRKIKPEVFENPDRYSLVPLKNGFVVPGGRFKEVYYWDTYWIIEGLLISGMHETAKGMIENLIELLRTFGHIPNGSRWYYQERSQPPLLVAMVSLYYRETGDLQFIKDNIDYLEMEMDYWFRTQIVTFEKCDQAFTLLRYYAPSQGPRPESYSEDFTNAQILSKADRQEEFYVDIKSAAESGWDFSSRWFVDSNGDNTGNLTNIHTAYIVPVDLNSIFANALENLSQFYNLLRNYSKSIHYGYLARQWRSSIEQVFWNEEDGIWYDYDLHDNVHRKYFYPSNVAPLWMGAVEKKKLKFHSGRVLTYLKESHGLDYPGGVPSSLINSGEQWDFPNAWPPLVSIVVNALEALGTEDGDMNAFKVAQTWVRTNYVAFQEHRKMFEKYNVEEYGGAGGGGEYDVQEGFGWSNGVVLELLTKYGNAMTVDDSAVLPLVMKNLSYKQSQSKQ